MVEIKGEDLSEAIKTTKTLIEFIKRTNGENNLFIISLWFECLKLLKADCSRVQTGVIIHQEASSDTMLTRAKEVEANTLCVAHNLISKKLVEKAHLHDLTVNAWTLNSMIAFNRMRSLGVDYLSTDYPDRFKV